MTRSPLTRTLALSALLASTGIASAEKDTGPASARCDAHAKDTAAWTRCAATAEAGNDSELFYAGYWLAKSGRYAEALSYLNRTAVRDERVLTYIGFATRKLGETERAMGFYAEALAKNPDYAVARAYLGEAHLVRGDESSAAGELAEIARRCGVTCAEYADLAGHIETWRKTSRG